MQAQRQTRVGEEGGKKKQNNMATPAPTKTASPAPPPAKRATNGLDSKLTATQLANHTRACVTVHAMVVIILPIVTHVEVFETDRRLVSVGIVFWVTATAVGCLGFSALERRNNLMLCAYIVSCIITGAGLAVYSLLVDYLLASSCLVVQSAYDGKGMLGKSSEGGSNEPFSSVCYHTSIPLHIPCHHRGALGCPPSFL